MAGFCVTEHLQRSYNANTVFDAQNMVVKTQAQYPGLPFIWRRWTTKKLIDKLHNLRS